MASPFSKEEKQMLLEAKDLEFRKKKIRTDNQTLFFR